jgi:probable HAF family extracellular repeat protein
MHKAGISRLTVFATVCAWLIAAHRATAAYSILDLGSLGSGFSFSDGFGSVNLAGQVVGWSNTAGGAPVHAFRTASNAPITPASDLGTLGGAESHAYGINSSGQAVGFSSRADGVIRAFRTAPNGNITASSELATPTLQVFSYAFAINDAGQTVGKFQPFAGPGPFHAFRTAPGGDITAASDLGTLGGTESAAIGINSIGQAAGWARTAGGQIHAFRTAPNASITAASDLGTLGGPESQANGVNDSGQAVGYSGAHAFRTSPNGLITPASDLGTLGGNSSNAFAINSLGQVVGTSTLTDGSSHAFFVDVTGAMQDLNNLIPPASGWTLTEAHGINDLGQIAGFGHIGAEDHAFLLTPVPEPATIAFLGLCVSHLGFRRRHTSARR